MTKNADYLQRELAACVASLEDMALGRGDYADESEADILDEYGEIKEEYLDCAYDAKVAESLQYERLREYFDGVLDVEFVIGGRGDYRGVILTLALSPNVYLNTSKRFGGYFVKAYWGTSFAESPLDREAGDIIDDYWREQAEMLFNLY